MELKKLNRKQIISAVMDIYFTDDHNGYDIYRYLLELSDTNKGDKNLSSDVSEHFTPCQLFENFTVNEMISLVDENVRVYERILSKIKNMCDIP